MAWAPPAHGAEIKLTDVDGKIVVLNKPGRVTVVLYCTEETQEQTRLNGTALDAFKGRADFRYVVLLDLRDSLASLAKGYVKRRVQSDLDVEAKRLKSFYKKNGNDGDPRKISRGHRLDGAVMRVGGSDPRPPAS
jgi:hypothetical protein